MDKNPKKPNGRTEEPPADYQPSKAELEADVSIPGTSDELLAAVLNYDPRRDG